MTTQKDISQIAERVRQAPAGQRTAALIDNMAQQCQQSDNQEVQQFGEQLRQGRQELLNAVQQQQR